MHYGIDNAVADAGACLKHVLRTNFLEELHGTLTFNNRFHYEQTITNR